MQISNKTINNAINRKFIRPLKDGCIYNVSKLLFLKNASFLMFKVFY